MTVFFLPHKVILIFCHIRYHLHVPGNRRWIYLCGHHSAHWSWLQTLLTSGPNYVIKIWFRTIVQLSLVCGFGLRLHLLQDDGSSSRFYILSASYLLKSNPFSQKCQWKSHGASLYLRSHSSVLQPVTVTRGMWGSNWFGLSHMVMVSALLGPHALGTGEKWLPKLK